MSGDYKSKILDIETFYRLKEEYGEQKPEWSKVQGLDETTKTFWNAWEETTMKNEVLYRKTIDKVGNDSHLADDSSSGIEAEDIGTDTPRHDGRPLRNNKN